MLKWLLVLAVLALALAWWTIGRRGGRGGRHDAPGSPSAAGRQRAEPATMLACAHCGVHLPQPEALIDAGGRPYCSEAHRLAGPR
jgi:uncharacterized protein